MDNITARGINITSAYCPVCTMCGPLVFGGLPDEDELIEMELEWAEHVQSHMGYPYKTEEINDE